MDGRIKPLVEWRHWPYFAAMQRGEIGSVSWPRRRSGLLSLGPQIREACLEWRKSRKRPVYVVTYSDQTPGLSVGSLEASHTTHCATSSITPVFGPLGTDPIRELLGASRCVGSERHANPDVAYGFILQRFFPSETGTKFLNSVWLSQQFFFEERDLRLS